MERQQLAPPEFSRRSLLQAMAATLALSSAAGRAARADQHALPQAAGPGEAAPDRFRWYATSVDFCGYAQPVLGKTERGRPVKLEGNPQHPATEGGTDLFMQAALLGLYDPLRSQAPSLLGVEASWSAFDSAVAARRALIERGRGEGFRLLTGTVTSPTLARQLDLLQQRWPRARWHVAEPVDDQARLEGCRGLFGRALQPHVRFEEAEVVVSLDDDFLGPGPLQAAHARRWSKRRLARQQGDGQALLFVAEPTLSASGTMADDRLPASSAALARLAAALAGALGLPDVPAVALEPRQQRWVERVGDALARHRGRAVVSVGIHQPVWLHRLGLLINRAIGSFGRTLSFTDPLAVAPPDGAASLRVLRDDMMAGRVHTLFVLAANPVHATPAALGFGAALDQVAFSLHAGLHADETALRCHWHVPLPHDLEAWTDGRAVDGTANIFQPLVQPLYATRSRHELLAGWLGDDRAARDIVRSTWRERWQSRFDERWRDALVRGFVGDSAPAAIVPEVVDPTIDFAELPAARPLVAEIRPDASLWDGRFFNNAWLQETPRPLTKVTWGNVVLVSPQLAAERGLAAGDQVRLEADGRAIVGPAWIMPGQDAHTVVLSLGYGRALRDRLADGLGYDAFALCDPARPWRLESATLTATGQRETIATTQPDQAMDGYDFVRRVARPDAPVPERGVPGRGVPGRGVPVRGDRASFYPARRWDSPSWGMSIDLDLCIGCNACLVACTAENNVATVGKELVAQGREMLWLRVDHYVEGDPAEPRSYFQPVPCMHCEQAPCEMGCPVNAAVHSQDGLNLQVYNRCIGTRTCSAYCPYKVRRFNWFDYTQDDPSQLREMRNPEVTVRGRGVMEKCTYCVQRISAARIAAKIAGRPIGDGEVVTACQQACPAQAIAFGDVVDPATAVSRRKASPRDYALLEEANTRPRTTYLARIEQGPDK
jgi:molybdopterin-containing oxidoreductase family iron-sulfur binding subunit